MSKPWWQPIWGLTDLLPGSAPAVPSQGVPPYLITEVRMQPLVCWPHSWEVTDPHLHSGPCPPWPRAAPWAGGRPSIPSSGCRTPRGENFSHFLGFGDWVTLGGLLDHGEGFGVGRVCQEKGSGFNEFELHFSQGLGPSEHCEHVGLCSRSGAVCPRVTGCFDNRPPRAPALPSPHILSGLSFHSRVCQSPPGASPKAASLYSVQDITCFLKNESGVHKT